MLDEHFINRSQPIKKPLISVVIPVFNEETVLPFFIQRITSVLASLANYVDYELLFIDDGSDDGTNSLLTNCANADPCVRVISFSRNFGHQAALAAGFDFAQGAAVITIDSDLQDPPEVISFMIDEWTNGAEVVTAQRLTRAGEKRSKRLTAALFYKIISALSNVELSKNVGDFRLLDREVVDVIRNLKERDPYYRGLTDWVGFKKSIVQYDRDPRFAGKTKYSWRKMFRLAFDGVTAFSDKPLNVVSLLGILLMFLSFTGSVFALTAKFLDPERAVPGYLTLLLAVLFLGGIQLFSIGVLGIYLSIVNRNAKLRPHYIVSKKRSKNLD
jgi:dolichol-phosphate mannosyltransferase